MHPEVLSDLRGFFSRLFGASSPAKDRPRILVHVAFDGAIRVFETPTSEGWQAAEDQRQGEDFTVMVLKYILPMEPMPLGLLAKIYTMDGGCQPPQDPSSTDWRAEFQALFSSFSNVETRASKQLTMTDSLTATEAVIEGVGADPAVPLRVRERRAVLGNEKFIVTAIGSPAAFDQHAGEIEQWFSTSAFVPLGQAKKG
jgi:hypothetical protein